MLLSFGKTYEKMEMRMYILYMYILYMYIYMYMTVAVAAIIHKIFEANSSFHVK